MLKIVFMLMVLIALYSFFAALYCLLNSNLIGGVGWCLSLVFLLVIVVTNED